MSKPSVRAKPRRTRSIMLGAALALVAVLISGCDDEPSGISAPVLLSKFAATASTTQVLDDDSCIGITDKHIVDQLCIELDGDGILGAARVGAEALQLDLPGGERVDVKRTAFEYRPYAKGCPYTWTGSTPGERDNVLLTLCDDGPLAVEGRVALPDRYLRIQPAGVGVHAIREIDPGMLPPAISRDDRIFDYSLPKPTGVRGGPPPSEQGIPVVDVAILHTARLEQTVRCRGEHLGAQAQFAIDEANLVLRNSQAGARLRLAFFGGGDLVRFGLTERADFSALMLNLLNQEIFGMAELRDRVGADLVSLWVTPVIDRDCDGVPDERGFPEMFVAGQGRLLTDSLGLPEDAFLNVVSQGVAVGPYYTFVHEIGHNLGAHHDTGAPTPGPGLFPFSSGYVHALTRYSFATVMGHTRSCERQGVPSDYVCPRVPFFSTPRLTTNGFPLGDADADNTQTVSRAAKVVSEYRTEGFDVITVQEAQYREAITPLLDRLVVIARSSRSRTDEVTLTVSVPDCFQGAPMSYDADSDRFAFQSADNLAACGDLVGQTAVVRSSLGGQFHAIIR